MAPPGRLDYRTGMRCLQTFTLDIRDVTGQGQEEPQATGRGRVRRALLDAGGYALPRRPRLARAAGSSSHGLGGDGDSLAPAWPSLCRAPAGPGAKSVYGALAAARAMLCRLLMVAAARQFRAPASGSWSACRIPVDLNQVRNMTATTAAVTKGRGLRADTRIVLVHDPAADLVSGEARISVTSSPVELQALAVSDIVEASKPPSYRVVKNGEDWNSAPLAYRTVALYDGFKARQVHAPGARLTPRRILPHFNAAALHGWEQPSSVVHVARSLARGSGRILCNCVLANQDPASAGPSPPHGGSNSETV